MNKKKTNDNNNNTYIEASHETAALANHVKINEKISSEANHQYHIQNIGKRTQ